MGILSFNILLFWIWINSTVHTVVSTAELGVANFQTTPDNQAGVPGDDLMFACQVVSGVNDEFEIREYITDTVSGARIYDNINDKVINPDKYEVSGKYDLKVKNLAFSDGGRYVCSLFNGDKHSVFYAMVVETPQVSLSSNSINEGDDVTVTCEARYGADGGYEHEDPHPGEGEHVPYVDIRLGSSSLGQPQITHRQDTPGSGQPFTVKATVSYRATRAQHHGNLTCTVRAYNRDFTGAQEVLINHESTAIDFFPATQMEFDVGENITCQGNGYPRPAVTWTDVVTDRVIATEETLVFSEAMLGDREYRCSVAQSGQTLQKSILFTVVQPQSGGSTNGAEGKALPAYHMALLHSLILMAASIILHL